MQNLSCYPNPEDIGSFTWFKTSIERLKRLNNEIYHHADPYSHDDPRPKPPLSEEEINKLWRIDFICKDLLDWHETGKPLFESKNNNDEKSI